MERAKAKARNARLKSLYGITARQWNRIFDRQEGLCPICLKPILKPDNPQGKRAAAVDHDHKTGRVRGLLHFRCNKYYVGRVSLDISRRVTAYLESEFDGRDI